MSSPNDEKPTATPGIQELSSSRPTTTTSEEVTQAALSPPPLPPPLGSTPSEQKTVTITTESDTTPESESKDRQLHDDNEEHEAYDDDDDTEEGEVDEAAEQRKEAEEVNSANPPLPTGPPPTTEDDGWDFHWDATHQAYYFFNRLTGQATWENPRTSSSAAAATLGTENGGLGQQPQKQTIAQEQPLMNSASLPPPPTTALPAGGYNPAIHGDYDPEAWYAKGSTDPSSAQPDSSLTPQQATELYASTGTFNRFSGGHQAGSGSDEGQGTERHTDEAKSRRQMNAFFDVDAAANQHDGRSLRAERSGIKPSKKDLKKFKEKRRAKKEEKRRAWLKE
ncbi:hypothetical protein MKZ38_006095 [Zalerion maritima]|uniref:WW domain-containing protein n=1 Tax=Zalerion maritima TaxID=339359 RepID=A0AAD5RXL4_9PEZI|nr:hypothetical protein MKZ38_006095 [Zalerion maritima]